MDNPMLRLRSYAKGQGFGIIILYIFHFPNCAYFLINAVKFKLSKSSYIVCDWMF